jgi:hypothetical protein
LIRALKGSNPFSSAPLLVFSIFNLMAEYWFSKLKVKGSTPLKCNCYFCVRVVKLVYTPGLGSGVLQECRGSSPLSDRNLFVNLNSSVVEQWTENPRVSGSIPLLGISPVVIQFYTYEIQL